MTQSNNFASHWDNYDLILWKKDHQGFTNIKGIFRDNAWGIAERISVDNSGTWTLPRKYVRYFK